MIPLDLRTLLEHGGNVVTTAQANQAGISNERLRLLVKSGDLQRIAHGVYMEPHELEDRMYTWQLRRAKLIYSHDTALFLHGLTDRDPLSYTVTVPSGYNTSGLRMAGFTVFTIKPTLHEVGIGVADTVFGNPVRVYGLERTVCDIVRSRSRLDPAIISEAVKRYVSRRDKNLGLLMPLAGQFGIARLLRTYLEVLL